MGTVAAVCLITIPVCLVLVRTLPRPLAVPFFWLGAYALATLLSIPFVCVLTTTLEAVGWRR